MFLDTLRTPTRRLPSWSLGVLLGLSVVSAPQAQLESAVDSIAFEEAWERTLRGSPDLAARNLEVKAMEARASHVGRRPNPELGLEAENFAGSGPLAGVDGLESTLQLGQVIEMGGKRKARQKVAQAETDLVRREMLAARIGLKGEVRSAFTDVLAAQERLRLLEAGLEINQQILETAKLRHGAGKAPATEAMKARMAYSLHHIEIDRASQELRSSRIRLATYWSPEAPSFTAVKGSLQGIPALPPLPVLLNRVLDHPELARWKAESAQRQLGLDAARAERTPDLTVAGGVRHLNDGEGGDLALVAGISLPLALFNRNQGSIAEAGHRLAKAGKEREALEARLRARVRTLHETLSARSEEITHLKDELLPDAEKTLEASREAYRMGKLSFLEVLDSQRSLGEIGTRYISTLAEYHKDWNELESLVTPSDRNTP